jgi:diamine N-acetyltransferase
MNDVTLRQADLPDAERLVELAKQTYYETFSSVNTPENMQAYLSTAFTLAQFQSDLRNPRVTIYVAENEEGFVAYAKLVAREAPECVKAEAPIELERLYVDSRWHGSGVASTLMEKCFEAARRDGFKAMYLGVWEHNLRAQAFYRKWAFVRVGEHIFQMGDDPQTDWWMMRRL